MDLKSELGLRKRFQSGPHEAILSIYYTASRLRKHSTAFFRRYGLTDVQFNVLMLLRHQCEDRRGLTQVELSRMLLVNRSNVTTLVDRMEKAGLVERRTAPEDRRCYLVSMTARGRGALRKAESAYNREVAKAMGALKLKEVAQLTRLLERIRGGLPE